MPCLTCVKAYANLFPLCSMAIIGPLEKRLWNGSPSYPRRSGDGQRTPWRQNGGIERRLRTILGKSKDLARWFLRTGMIREEMRPVEIDVTRQ